MEGKNESKHTPEKIRKEVQKIFEMNKTRSVEGDLLADLVMSNSAPALLEVTRELISVIKEIENNWISADHYSGSETNDKAYSAIIKANKIINGK